MTDLQGIYPVVIFTYLIIICGFLAGCTSASPAVSTPDVSTPALAVSPAPLPTSRSNTVERVEVFHFHGTQQCYSCITVGNLAEQTVNASFKEELASGRLVFAHVNYDLSENAALKTKYGVTGSSLWIGVYDADGFHRRQDIRVWSLIKNKDAFSAYLSELITKRLNGDLS
jgi:hypothetical protein